MSRRVGPTGHTNPRLTGDQVDSSGRFRPLTYGIIGKLVLLANDEQWGASTVWSFKWDACEVKHGAVSLICFTDFKPVLTP